jgi:F420-dependent oxidoreductase-like protein
MRFCLMVEGQEGITWEQWLALSESCERLGFEGLFTSDHYFSVIGAAGRGSSDAWTVLSALAARTERLRLGTLVSPVTFRLPTVLAKVATTVDHISGGRVEIGMGAGWWEEEHMTHGIPFPATNERMQMLEEQLEIVHGLLSDEVFSFHGEHYTLQDCRFVPKGVQRPHPPIIVGGKGGSRISRLVATWADEFNTYGGTPKEVGDRFARVREAVDASGRDQDAVTTSLMTWVYVGEDDRSFRERVERVRQLAAEAGPSDDYLTDDELNNESIAGTPDRAAERLSEYAAAGVQRVFLNHSLYDDLDTLELLARDVFPNVAG